MDPTAIIEALKRYKVPHDRIADVIGRDRTAATKMLAGTRSIKAGEVEPLRLLALEFGAENMSNTPDQLEHDPAQHYEPVGVLPTFAGAGGGGTGEGPAETALVSRRLIRAELHAKPSDLLLINIRGDSMEPLFRHGDQLLIDCRDRNPTQPGPFALLYGDGYVVKNVEWLRKANRLRVFSSNPAYSAQDFDPEDVSIMGRPVWFARRL